MSENMDRSPSEAAERERLLEVVRVARLIRATGERYRYQGHVYVRINGTAALELGAAIDRLDDLTREGARDA